MIFLGVNRFSVSVNVSADYMVSKELLLHADFAYKRDSYSGMWSFIKYRFHQQPGTHDIQFFSVEALHRYIEDTAGIPVRFLERIYPIGVSLSVPEAIKLMRSMPTRKSQ